MPRSRFALVPSAYVLLFRTGSRGEQVLLQRRANTGFMDGYWASAAAGHVEFGESCAQTAVREAREELGIALGESDLLPLCAVHRHQETDRPIDQRVDFFFGCRSWSGEPSLQEYKATDLQWYDLDGLPDPVVPHELQVLRAAASGSPPPVTSFGF